MSVSAETYIVISLMFAVFAAFAAVGTSVVLGAGFERLRAGFDHVRRQSGFFADAIYKLDQRTQKLDEETSKLKAGLYGMEDRVNRVEKQTTFMAEAVNSIEQRILQGSPAQPSTKRVQATHTFTKPQPKVQINEWVKQPAKEQVREPEQPELRQHENLVSGMFRDFPEGVPAHSDRPEFQEAIMEEPHDASGGLTTLLARYFTGESSGSGKGVVYH